MGGWERRFEWGGSAVLWGEVLRAYFLGNGWVCVGCVWDVDMGLERARWVDEKRDRCVVP